MGCKFILDIGDSGQSLAINLFNLTETDLNKLTEEDPSKFSEILLDVLNKKLRKVMDENTITKVHSYIMGYAEEGVYNNMEKFIYDKVSDYFNENEDFEKLLETAIQGHLATGDDKVYNKLLETINNTNLDKDYFNKNNIRGVYKPVGIKDLYNKLLYDSDNLYLQGITRSSKIYAANLIKLLQPILDKNNIVLYNGESTYSNEGAVFKNNDSIYIFYNDSYPITIVKSLFRYILQEENFDKEIDFESFIKNIDEDIETVSDLLQKKIKGYTDKKVSKSILNNLLLSINKDFDANLARDMILNDKIKYQKFSNYNYAIERHVKSIFDKINENKFEGYYYDTISFDKELILNFTPHMYKEAKKRLHTYKDFIIDNIRGENTKVLITNIYSRKNGVLIEGFYELNGELYTHSVKYTNSGSIKIYKHRGRFDAFNIDIPSVFTNDFKKSTETSTLPKLDLSKNESLRKDLRKLLIKNDVIEINGDNYYIDNIYDDYVEAYKIIGAEEPTEIKFIDIQILYSNMIYSVYKNTGSKGILHSDAINLVEDNKNNLETGDILIFKPDNATKKEYLVLENYSDGWYKLLIKKNNFNDNEIVVLNIDNVAYGNFTHLRYLNKYNITIPNDTLVYSTFNNIKDIMEGDIIEDRENFRYIAMSPNKVIDENNKIVSVHNLDISKIYTDRNIASSDYLDIVDVNNPTLLLKEPSKDIIDNYKKVEYIYEDFPEDSDIFIFPNGYPNKGRFTEVSKDSKNNSGELLNKYKNLGYFAKSFYIAKNLNSENKFLEISNWEELTIKERSDLSAFNKGNYISMITSNDSNYKVYKVIKSEEEGVTLQYSNYENGNLITDIYIAKEEDLTSNKSFPKINKIYYTEDTIKTAVSEKEEPFKELSTLYKQNLIGKTKKFFEDFSDVEVSESDDSAVFNNNQKAAISTFKEGEALKFKLLINTSKSDYNDVIHENLHIALTALRYTNFDTYARMLEKVTKFSNENGDINSFLKQEEILVEQLVKYNKGKHDFLYEDMKSIYDALDYILSKMSNVSNFRTRLSRNSTINTKLLDILNNSLGMYLNVDKNNESGNPFINKSLLLLEPVFRNWTEKEGITIKCE